MYLEEAKQVSGIKVNKSAKKFTKKQLETLPHIVTSKTYLEAGEKAGVSNKQICEWMHQEAFSGEVRRLQDEILNHAICSLKSASTKAVDVLVYLLDDEDARIKRGVANDILNHAMKFKELQELEGRIFALEKEK